ncbi:DUF2804 domain-containing protein [Euzebya sp.]|uniref:DUF2804 domain-containing protein n=1 Tax=Euzebya sp. TaxID=1971409 RepID=UPI0035149664
MPATTPEPELTTRVDLATPDGRRLNPAARGWSRHPLHRANLRGSWGRTKRWDYWAVLAGDLVVSALVADIDYVGMAEVWWADLATGATGGAELLRPLAVGIDLPEMAGTVPVRVRGRGLDLALRDDASGATHLAASWRDRDGRPGTLDVVVDLPPGHQSLNVVIPWTDRRFQYTSKHQARPARGRVAVGDRTWVFGSDDRPAWGVLDVGRGRWPYTTRWNWGGGAGPATGADDVVVGLQLGGRWTAGTGATENGILVDGRLTKIGTELTWDYDWDAPLRPWRVHDPDGHLDVTLHPRHDEHSTVDLAVLRRETHQVFGTWTGWVRDADGRRLELDAVQGFAEESRARW